MVSPNRLNLNIIQGLSAIQLRGRYNPPLNPCHYHIPTPTLPNLQTTATFGAALTGLVLVYTTLILHTNSDYSPKKKIKTTKASYEVGRNIACQPSSVHRHCQSRNDIETEACIDLSSTFRYTVPFSRLALAITNYTWSCNSTATRIWVAPTEGNNSSLT